MFAAATTTATATTTTTATATTLTRLQFFNDLDTIAVNIDGSSNVGAMCNLPSYGKWLVKVNTFFQKFPDWHDNFIWDKQRQINIDTVNDIVRAMDGKSNDILLAHMDIRFGLVCGVDPKIIDGQHRLAALEKLPGDTLFIVTVNNFVTECERFQTYATMNSNTPLPEYYRAISNYDSYCHVMAQEIYSALASEYQDLCRDEPLFLRLSDRDGIYQALRQANIPMQINMADAVQRYRQRAASIDLFPVNNSHYTPMPINPDKCHAQQTKDNQVQCKNAKKDGEYCGIHRACGRQGSSCRAYNPRVLLGTRYDERRLTKRGLFLLDRNWHEKILTDEGFHQNSVV